MSATFFHLNIILQDYKKYYLLIAVLLSLSFPLFSQEKSAGNNVSKTNNRTIPRAGIDGVSDTKRKAEDIQKAEKITAGEGYTVVGFTLYFGGAGFRETVAAQVSGNSFGPLKELTSRLIPGSFIALDKVRVKDENGKEREIPGFIITLF